MQQNEEFTFYVNGRLHGDHVDDTGRYQREFAEHERAWKEKMEAKSAISEQKMAQNRDIPAPPPKKGSGTLTEEEKVEFRELQELFEVGGPGNYHADHVDETPDYDYKFRRYLKFAGKSRGAPPQSAITSAGKVVNPDWKKKLADIISEERIRINN